MTNMKPEARFRRAAFVVLLSLFATGASGQTVGQWEVFEISLTARGAYSNAYVEGLPASGEPLVRVTFSGVSGEARGLRYVVAGFWDGGPAWKVRFGPPASGEWSYVSSSADAGLNGVKGTFRATAWTAADLQANPARHGFVHVAQHGPRAGRYFEYADGTPFLWIGDTWWAWAKKGIQFSSFKKLADDRAAKGFSVGQMYFSGQGWLLDSAHEVPDLEQIRKVEQFIAYANSKGITVWIHPWWSRERLNENVGPEKIRRWWRYVIHRLGAYNVIWVLAGEYNMYNYGGLGLSFWKDLGAMVRREDPYQRIIGAHPTPPGWEGGAAAPQWSTGEVLHNEPWLDYNQSQVGHGKWRNEMIPEVVAADYDRTPAKPVVVTEPWYEFVRGNAPAEDIRFGAWSAILSGAAGHTYGGGHVWWADVPEAPADQDGWPLEPGFESDTFDYPGAVSISFLAHFMRSIRWWTLEPNPELLSDYSPKFCSAVPGQEYVIYLRWGGTVKVDLRPSAESDTFRYTWIDLVEGKERSSGTVQGGAVRELSTVEDFPKNPQYKDWLLHIYRVHPVAQAPESSNTAPSTRLHSLKHRHLPESSPYAKWLNEDVVYLIAGVEREAFYKLVTDEEREMFVEQFWERRNPVPGSKENKFKEEHYRRIAYVNAHFATNKPGWQTDPGRIYILFGPPDEIDARASGSEFGFKVEEWRYRHLDGFGDNVTFTFIDYFGDGEYRLWPGELPDQQNGLRP
jgi:GWxTD domain-containing protein